MHAPDGTPFRYDSDFAHDRLAQHVVWTDLEDWERTVQSVLCELARTAEVFVDVGAYSGIHTVMACAANPGLRAVACEPNPIKLEQIAANVVLNGGNAVLRIPIALASADREEKVREDFRTLPGVDDLRMKLHSVKPAPRLGHGSDSARAGCAQHGETTR